MNRMDRIIFPILQILFILSKICDAANSQPKGLAQAGRGSKPHSCLLH